MRPGHAADHSPPSSAAVMEEQSYTSTYPLGRTRLVKGTFYLFTKPINSSVLNLQASDKLSKQLCCLCLFRGRNFIFK